MVALLAGGLLYLWLQLCHYQLVDYSYVIRQDERERQTLSRLAALEQLVGDLGDFDRMHRADLAEMLSSSQAQLELQAQSLREMLASARQDAPAQGPAPAVPQTSRRPRLADPAHKPGAAPNGTLLFLRNERQWDIAARLRNGDSAPEISRELGISLHEVELVRSVINRQRKSA